jgi:hypothetical protein
MVLNVDLAKLKKLDMEKRMDYKCSTADEN